MVFDYSRVKDAEETSLLKLTEGEEEVVRETCKFLRMFGAEYGLKKVISNNSQLPGLFRMEEVGEANLRIHAANMMEAMYTHLIHKKGRNVKSLEHTWKEIGKVHADLNGFKTEYFDELKTAILQVVEEYEAEDEVEQYRAVATWNKIITYVIQLMEGDCVE